VISRNTSATELISKKLEMSSKFLGDKGILLLVAEGLRVNLWNTAGDQYAS